MVNTQMGVRIVKLTAQALLVPVLLSTSMLTSPVYASGYEFSATAGTYVEISGATVLGTSANDDEVFSGDTVGDFPPGAGAGFPIGFNLTLGGATYDRFAVSSNGWIVLGAGSVEIGTAVGNNFTPLSTAGPGFQTAVSAVGVDLQGHPDSELSYLTSGEPGSRVLTVQWKKYGKYEQWKNYGNYETSDDSFNFQIRLHEGSNRIEIVYGTVANDLEATAVQVGFRDGTVDCLTNRTTTSDWASSTPGETSDAAMVLSNTVFPSAGLTFSWTPVAP